MFIKQVLFEGFRSYRDQCVIEEFHPGVNLIVGPNGSGKSNLLYAIRFVLSDLYHSLRAEDRQAILNDAQGGASLSTTYVEIVFDNGDNRLPIDKEEVRLRRVVGLKKDDFYLDSKHITKGEVMDLLESAGFSRSNPYYVVQQGKIASLAVMKESDRLDLLKDIAGTRVYDERRQESLKILKDTENKRQQVLELLGYIDEKIKELEEEKDELRNYQQLDKQKRSVEYTLYDLDLQHTRAAINDIESKRSTISSESSQIRNQLNAYYIELEASEKTLKQKHLKAESLNKEKASAENESNYAQSELAKAEADLHDCQNKYSIEASRIQSAQRELSEVTLAIDNAERALTAAKQEYIVKRQIEEKQADELQENELKANALHQIEGSAQQFKSKKERDSWLKKEIAEFHKTLEIERVKTREAEDEIKALNLASSDSSKTLANEEGDIGMKRKELESCKQFLADTKRKRDEYLNKQRATFDEEGRTEDEIRITKDELQKSEKQLEYSVAREINRGLSSVHRIVKEKGIQGVHGTVIELFECDDQFFTAVEVTGGNQLFNVVVENDQIASTLVKELNKTKGGRVTFMPLNRLKSKNITYPSSSDIVPMISKLRFDKKLFPAFQQIFGKTVLCRDLDVASNIAHNSEFNSITLEGDQVNKRGALTGGFQDFRQSRLVCMKSIKAMQQRLQDLYQKQESIKQQSADLAKMLLEANAELQHKQAKADFTRKYILQNEGDLRKLKEKQRGSRDAIERRQEALNTHRRSVIEMERTIKSLESQIGTDIHSQLSAQEHAQLSVLTEQMAKLREALLLSRTERMQAETKVTMLTSDLNENLIRRKEELELIAVQHATIVSEDEIENLKSDVMNLRAETSNALRRYQQTSDELEKERQLVREMKVKHEEVLTQKDAIETKLASERAEIDLLINKRTSFLSKRDELMKKIRDLGSVPSDVDKYSRKSIRDLKAILSKCNQELQQYGHVNKKALDQYVNFTEQRESLLTRSAELDRGDEKISELIRVLDNKKDEAIERTFKQVSKNFREIFHELTGGTASLVMQKKNLSELEGEAEDNADNDAPRKRLHKDHGKGFDRYEGVKVKVSFGLGDTLSLNKLSGGQKTVVALALIFAIQRCDPAPFYIFDEIDAALDPQYRASVARMVKRLAQGQNTQFIATTFRPELVQVADRIYGVQLKNRASIVSIIEKEQADNFVNS